MDCRPGRQLGQGKTTRKTDARNLYVRITYASDNMVLRAHDGLVGQRSGKVGVIAETLPISSTLGDSTKRANDGSKKNVD